MFIMSYDIILFVGNTSIPAAGGITEKIQRQKWFIAAHAIQTFHYWDAFRIIMSIL